MNWLSLIIALSTHVVLGIQTVIGDKASGATKQQMAKDALAVAIGGAGAVLTGSNATYADAAGKIVGLVFVLMVRVTKATGAYQKATEIANAAQQDTQVAAAVGQLVQSVEKPAPAPATPPVSQ